MKLITIELTSVTDELSLQKTFIRDYNISLWWLIRLNISHFEIWRKQDYESRHKVGVEGIEGAGLTTR